jgi:hypothetical protein
MTGREFLRNTTIIPGASFNKAEKEIPWTSFDS